MTLELRLTPEVRIAAGGRTLYGVACPFGQVTTIRSASGTFREVVAPGAFTACLAAGADCSALADHDGRALLGRVRSGSLALTETPAGLAYTLDVAATAAGDDICTLASRGELAGCSIGFTIAPGGESWDEGNLRTLTAVNLHHIAIISGGDPAYSNTTANLRHQVRRNPLPEALRRRRWLATL